LAFASAMFDPSKSSRRRRNGSKAPHKRACAWRFEAEMVENAALSRRVQTNRTGRGEEGNGLVGSRSRKREGGEKRQENEGGQDRSLQRMEGEGHHVDVLGCHIRHVDKVRVPIGMTRCHVARAWCVQTDAERAWSWTGHINRWSARRWDAQAKKTPSSHRANAVQLKGMGASQTLDVGCMPTLPIIRIQTARVLLETSMHTAEDVGDAHSYRQIF